MIDFLHPSRYGKWLSRAPVKVGDLVTYRKQRNFVMDEEVIVWEVIDSLGFYSIQNLHNPSCVIHSPSRADLRKLSPLELLALTSQ